MNFADYYYTEICGYYPNDESFEKTNKVFEYLKEANISNKEIVKFILSCDKKEELDFSMLPEFLWENSLIEKDKFYYHRILHIKSKPPKWNIKDRQAKTSKFYLEMIIKFTVKDIIDYFYRTLGIDKILYNEKTDVGAVQFLLDKYKKFNFIEPVDFVLALIDYAKDNVSNNKITTIIQLSQYESEVYEILKTKTIDANFNKKNRIIWR